MTKLELFGRNDRRDPHTAFEENLVPTFKYGGGSIMIWVYVAAAVTDKILLIDSAMVSAR